MERAILFFDIDGTVLSEVTKEVPQSAIEANGKKHERKDICCLLIQAEQSVVFRQR